MARPSATLGALAPAGAIQKDMAHQPRGDSEEVGAVLPVRILLIN